MPLSFERNAGQVAEESAAWVGRANSYRVALGATSATIIPAAPGRSDVVLMEFVNARKAATAQALEPLPGKTNYLIGRDPSRWIQNLATYGRIEYQNVYDGIDVAWYGNQGQLEYDFWVQPGADPSRIRVRFEGTRKLALEESGDVRIETAAGSMKLRLPEVYQEVAGARKRVQGRYVLRAANEIGFELAGYDKSKPLVIDPTLVYGTYFGAGGVFATGVVTDAAGNVYIAGTTQGNDLPAVNAAQAGDLGYNDAFVAKFNPTGTVLLYSTFLGGSSEESNAALAVDGSGECIVAGTTSSLDFPLVNPVQSQGSANGIPFAAKLNAAGNGFVYSTYFGGVSAQITTPAVAADNAGNAYITGTTTGSFTTTSGAYQTAFGGGAADGYVVKFAPAGTIVYSTLLGGAGDDRPLAIVVDGTGKAYVAGATNSASFPNSPPGARTTNAGGMDAFAASLSADGSAVEWLTLLGGSGDDTATSIVRNGTSGELYIAGYTGSPDLPTTAGVIQPAPKAPQQGFLASIAPDGMSFGFVTYLGGSKWDQVLSLALTPSGDLVAGGTTRSPDFPILNAIQPAFAGNSSVFLKSTDSGAVWTVADSGLPIWNGPSAISPDPTNPSIALTVYPWSLTVYRTTDGGATWTPAGAPILNISAASTYGSPQFVRSPADPAVVYLYYPWTYGAGPTGQSQQFNVARSSDGGATWTALAQPAGWPGDLAGLAVSPTDASKLLAISPDFGNSRLLVYRSTDGGASFSAFSTVSLFEIQLGGWGYSATAVGSDGSVYFGTNNLFTRSTDFGTTWSYRSLPAVILLVSASNPSVVYAGDGLSQLNRSADGGATWNPVASPPVYSTSPWAISPLNSQVLYADGSLQVLVSTDGATTWSPSALLPGSISALAAGPNDSSTVYATVTAVYDGFVTKLSPDGKTLRWSTLYAGASFFSPGMWAGNGTLLAGVAVDPSGDAWMTGSTTTGNLPITANAYSAASYNGGSFLARISDATAPCSYSLNPSSVVSYASFNDFLSFAVTAPSGCAWTAVPSDSSWITIRSGSSGTGSGVVSLALIDNTTGTTRNGTVSVNGQPYTIVQANSSCTYYLSGDGSLPTAGGTVSVTVTAPAGCPWTLAPQSPLSIVSGGSGTGNGTATVSLPANGGSQAFVTNVQIGYNTLTLQEADACTYSLSPSTLGAAAGSGTINVTVNLDGCYWYTNPSGSWLTINGYGYGSGSLSYSVTANTTGAPRSASITLDNRQLTITQLAEPFKVGTFNSGTWALDRNGNGVLDSGESFFLGFPGATAVLGDWNGDGRTKAGVYSNGYWYLDYNGDGVWDGGNVGVDKLVAWGWAGATPVVGDWNGDGKTKIGVYCNGVWFLDYDGNYQWDGGQVGVDKEVGWGWAGVTPVVGDWNGDGKTKIGVYSNGFWFLDYDGNYVWDGGNVGVDKAVGWGWAGVTPIVGDWNGDGKTKIGVYAGGYWYIDYDGTYLYDPTKDIWQLGWAGTTPVMGDWNGDGRTKAGAFIDGYWYLDYTGVGVFDSSGRIYAFGQASDTPVVGQW